MKKLLDNKIFNTFSSLIEWVIMIVLALLIVLVGVQKFSNRGNFFGYRIYTIISGSMIPTYDVGDTLLIKEMPANNIEVGDAVTYLGDGGALNGKIITHQVVSIEFDENGKYLFHTKGVANNIEDPIVSQDQVLGKVVHKFFFLTLLGKITTSMSLLFVFVTIPVAIIIAIEIVKLVYKKDEDIEEEVEEELEELEEEEKEKKEEEKIEEQTPKEEYKVEEKVVLKEEVLPKIVEEKVKEVPEQKEPVKVAQEQKSTNQKNKKKEYYKKYYNNNKSKNYYKKPNNKK